jgi:hypothetical protein
MPKETIFRATDPDGGHHYRGSVSRTYTHAVLRKFPTAAWHCMAFAGRPDLAEKEAASWRRSAAEHAAYHVKGGDEKRAADYRGVQVITAPVVVVDKRGA